jgi:hypothetical protein
MTEDESEDEDEDEDEGEDEDEDEGEDKGGCWALDLCAWCRAGARSWVNG